MLLSAIALTLSLTQLGASTIDPARVEAARANYEAVIHGRKYPQQLTPQELADVLAIAEGLDEGRHPGTRSQRCVANEKKRAGGKPSDLELRVINMKCREPGEKLK